MRWVIHLVRVEQSTTALKTHNVSCVTPSCKNTTENNDEQRGDRSAEPTLRETPKADDQVPSNRDRSPAIRCTAVCATAAVVALPIYLVVGQKSYQVVIGTWYLVTGKQQPAAAVRWK